MKHAFTIFVLILAGCGGSEFPLAPVSGTVTFDGEPLKGAEVVFAPMESDGVINVGPASVGITDDNGSYVLKPVRGEGDGAVVTKHRVSVVVKGIDEIEIAAKVEQINAENLNMPPRKVAALRQKFRQEMLKEIEGQVDVPKSYNKNTRLKFEVSGPTDDADFVLNSDGSIADR